MALTEEQLQKRKSYIGGSDIAAIVGLNPYRNITDIYHDKTNTTQNTQTTNEAIKLGEQLETNLVTYAAAKLQDTPILNITFKREWRRAQVDAYLPNREEVLEAKVVGFFNPNFKPTEWGPEGTTEVPVHYYLQVLWQMHVSNAKAGHLIALIGHGIGYRLYHIPRNQDIIDELEARAEHFWTQHVIPRVPPSEPASLSTYKALIREPLKRTNISHTLAEQYVTVMQESNHIDERKNKIKALILQQMGDAEIAITPSGDFYYKADKNGKRTLRFYPPKETMEQSE
jgi:putative phage-type endonuclease